MLNTNGQHDKIMVCCMENSSAKKPHPKSSSGQTKYCLNVVSADITPRNVLCHVNMTRYSPLHVGLARSGFRIGLDSELYQKNLLVLPLRAPKFKFIWIIFWSGSISHERVFGRPDEAVWAC
jgi:hypothetical protein